MKQVLSSLVFVAVCVCTVVPVTYSNEVEASTIINYPIVTEHKYQGVRIIVDNETGVNYIMKFHDKGVGLCPRYNADGTLYVSEVEET